MAYFLIEVIDNHGEQRALTTRVMEAASRQMVKYHYHRTQKHHGGYNPAWATDKHTIALGDGHVTELATVKEVSQEEYEVLDNYIPNWPTV